MPINYVEELDSLYTTTFQLRRKEIVDQVFLSTPFWYLLTKGGKRRTEQGGRWIEVPLAYSKNETVKYFGKGDTISIQDTDPLTVARWNWKYLAGTIARYFVDDQRNRGRGAVINLMNAKIDNLQRSLIDKMEVSLFGDGTGDSGKAIDGLGNIVAIAPGTGTVAGINRASYDWWRNNYKNMSGEAASVYLRKRMNTMFNDCGRLGEGVSRFPTLMICAQNVYEMYENELVEIKQIVNKELGDLG